MSPSSRVLLGCAIAFHLCMLASWRLGFFNPFFFDSVATGGWRGWDFFALYQAGHNFLQGDSVYQSDGDKIDVVVPRWTPFRYLPPSAYTVGVLLNLLPALPAFRAWVIFTELLLLFNVALTWRLVADRDLFARLAAMWLCFTPFYLEIYLGQFSMVQATLVFVAAVCLWQGSPNSLFDSAWIASVLWKVNTALFLPLMVRLRRWRAIVLLIGLVAITTVPYFVFFPDGLPAFLFNFNARADTHQLGNLGFMQLVFETLAGLFPGWPVQRIVLIQRALMLLFLGFSAALTFLDRRLDAVDHLCLWTTTFFLVFHQIWEHHYVMLLPVFVVLYLRTRSRTVLALYLLVAFFTPFYFLGLPRAVATDFTLRWTPLQPLWKGLLYHATKPVAALVLYVYLARRIVSSPGRQR